MLCLECGHNFRVLGSHLKRKHGLGHHDYCLKHNLPLMSCLVDVDVHEKRSRMARLRFGSKNGQDHLSEMTKRRESAPYLGPEALPACYFAKSRADRLRQKEQYRKKKLELIPGLMPLWIGGATMTEIKKFLGVGDWTVKEWVRLGLLPRRKQVTKYMVVS